jgi:hypothetical protein
MNAASLYEITPLDRTNQTVRLIKLVSSPDPFITCSFSCFPLSECPVYTALSYTWGEANPEKKIRIDGKQIRIRMNLWQFLHQMSSEERYGYYWIDAVCINQSDLDERNHQVNMMKDIYSSVGPHVKHLIKPKVVMD